MKKLPLLLCFFAFFCRLAAVCGQDQPALIITHLKGPLYIYTTHRVMNNAPFPSNGLYLVTDRGAVIFDNPWDTTQVQPLLDSIWHKHHQKVVLTLSTHFHDDRTGGINYYRSKGIATYSSLLTRELCKQHGTPWAAFVFSKDTVFRVGQYSFQTFFAGEGHTRDNIVIWFGKERVLYGGCLVKSTEAPDLGYLADANVEAWPNTIRKLQQKFPGAVYVIPGHQGGTSPRSLDHTLALLQNKKKER